jgi:hypothetical protein
MRSLPRDYGEGVGVGADPDGLVNAVTPSGLEAASLVPPLIRYAVFAPIVLEGGEHQVVGKDIGMKVEDAHRFLRVLSPSKI